ncbi:MAG TPA: tyrosine-type recombinase/integrase [Firmicutes bacterium]|jgi:site-specific recombinase XerD|nr:tyrosine-type recombinase/integrase [Bacillota bacterium]
MGKRVNFLPDSLDHQWNDAVEAFLHYKKATHRAPKTIRGYKHTLDIYYRRTEPDLNNPVSLKKSVLEFLGYYENPYSYNLHRTHLRAFFNWCIEENIIEGKNPVKGTPFKKTSPRIRHLDNKTLRILLGAPDKRTYDGFRDYTMMLVMLDCGIRSGELLQLLPRHFDVERATIHVVDSIAKTRVERILNISSPTVNAIRKVMSARHPLWGDNVPIFCSRDGREMTSSTWGHEFKKYVRRKNLDDAISPYDLRHTFAIMFLRNGGNLFALKTIMGHEQLEMTERYARFVGQDVKREHEKASPVRQLMSKRVR